VYLLGRNDMEFQEIHNEELTSGAQYYMRADIVPWRIWIPFVKSTWYRDWRSKYIHYKRNPYVRTK
jgi:hypothetical protein